MQKKNRNKTLTLYFRFVVTIFPNYLMGVRKRSLKLFSLLSRAAIFRSSRSWFSLKMANHESSSLCPDPLAGRFIFLIAWPSFLQPPLPSFPSTLVTSSQGRFLAFLRNSLDTSLYSSVVEEVGGACVGVDRVLSEVLSLGAGLHVVTSRSRRFNFVFCLLVAESGVKKFLFHPLRCSRAVDPHLAHFFCQFLGYNSLHCLPLFPFFSKAFNLLLVDSYQSLFL